MAPERYEPAYFFWIPILFLQVNWNYKNQISFMMIY